MSILNFPAPSLASEYRHTLAAVAPSSVPVLLLGGNRESLESAARLIHVKSTRAQGPFVMTRCGLYRGPLLEKRFFGRAAGSAKSYIRTLDRQAGQIELADSGTLYIDQIQHATPLMQDRLLQVLAENTFVDPVTGNLCSSSVRIIASTALSLKTCCARLNPTLAAQLTMMTLQLPAPEPAYLALAAS